MILEHVVPWGRTAQEYQEMFALSDIDLNCKILGCGDGPSSFNKAITARSGQVVSIDPVYKFSKDEINQRIMQTAPTVLKQVKENANDFVWTNIRSLEELEKLRMSAMQDFLEDYDRGKKEQRYVDAALPYLPLKDKSFDLALCSHFLFLYTDHFDLDFHIASVLEMCRVADEVRIFPLLTLNGSWSIHVEPLIKSLIEEGFSCQIEKVEYEFQKGGNEMLRIRSEHL